MRAVKAVFLGGLVVGTLDALDAIIFFGVRSGVGPGRIFQGIAAGVLGPGASAGGTPTVVLGIALHYLIATLIVLTCVAIVRTVPALLRRPALWGFAYGLIVFLVMYKLVIPLSNAGGTGSLPSGVALANGVLIHLFGVGLPAAFAARAALPRP